MTFIVSSFYFMKVLFIVRSTQLFHHYRSLVKELSMRGHHVTLLFDEEWSRGYSSEPIEEYKKCHNLNFVWGWSLRRTGYWRKIIFLTRELRTYRRFLLVKGQSAYYKERWPKYFPHLVRGVVKYLPGFDKFLCSVFIGRLLALLESRTLPDSKIIRDVMHYSPDVVVVAPLTSRFPEEIEYLKAAKKMGIPTATPALSWDSLTTKELIHVSPDILLVWNKFQIQEAQMHHAISPDQIRIIGAPMFDEWFSDMTPSLNREDFYKEWNLNVLQPYFLYLGSSRNMAPNEVQVVKYVVSALNITYTGKKEVQLVVRPHPANFKIYKDAEDLHIILIPKEGSLPNTVKSLQLYYDTLYHAAGVIVGVNTSAIFEAMIIRKPILNVLLEEYVKTQSATEHFRQLLSANVMEVAKLPEDVSSFIRRTLQGEDTHKKERKSIISQFLRPNGIHVSAADRFADEIESLIKRNRKII